MLYTILISWILFCCAGLVADYIEETVDKSERMARKIEDYQSYIKNQSKWINKLIVRLQTIEALYDKLDDEISKPICSSPEYDRKWEYLLDGIMTEHVLDKIPRLARRSDNG